ncbi:nuclear transport factor 2 family protein [Salinibius halmophilus]|uniref:nuclear transport factor 2 family protein n=1 Tax=Salinibius halmophilus TaxID=1853216 RepID=UPI000E66747F|nr:nuclear transport factor 2 family protein [Salinibius halmophilus]
MARNSIEVFFSAWELNDSAERLDRLKTAMQTSVTYADPKTPDSIAGIGAVNDYLGMFSANAPGWTASVVKQDTIASVTRVTVAFSGLGPGGKAVTQHGQYFCELEDDKLIRMIGFVGTGEPQ